MRCYFVPEMHKIQMYFQTFQGSKKKKFRFYIKIVSKLKVF